MNLVVLGGRQFNKDSISVWQLLHPLVLETPAWNYVKQYDETQNGRMAFLTLQTRGEGEAAVDARHTTVKDILKAKYTIKSKRFTLQSFINLFQGAFTERDGNRVEKNTHCLRDRRFQFLQKAWLQRNMRQRNTLSSKTQRQGKTVSGVTHLSRRWNSSVPRTQILTKSTMAQSMRAFCKQHTQDDCLVLVNWMQVVSSYGPPKANGQPSILLSMVDGLQVLHADDQLLSQQWTWVLEDLPALR
jgi:hypothetical protein